jgi:hypothetical protein
MNQLLNSIAYLVGKAQKAADSLENCHARVAYQQAYPQLSWIVVKGVAQHVIMLTFTH